MRRATQELQMQRDAARRQRDRLHDEDSEREYKRLHQEFKRQLTQARRDFFTAPSQSGNTKEMWNNLRKFALGPAAAGPLSGSVMDPNECNAFFAGVGCRVAEELNATPCEPVCPRPPIVCSSALRVHVVTLPELSNALRLMSDSRAAGSDGIIVQLLRECFEVVGPTVLHIINESLSSGVVPSIWKLATVVPIYKSGDKTSPANFRPVSVLNVISKLAEKVVNLQILSYLSTNNILTPTQFAYRPAHSTEDAALSLASSIAQNTDRGMVTSVTSLDLSKAFDCVERGALMSKLGWYGISTHWLESYFADRTQTVKGGTSTEAVPFGVVQGGTLGPTMFNLFMNDLATHIHFGRLYSYADDSQLEHCAKPDELSQLKRHIEADLGQLSRWFHSNGLKVNPTKTEFLLAGTQASTAKVSALTVNFEGVPLRHSESITILGVHFDSHLNWEKQVSSVAQKCNGTIVTIRKLKLPSETTKMLIQALVFPLITYCLPVWAPRSVNVRKIIENVINFAVRTVTGLRKFDHVSGARSNLGWLPFEAMIDLRDVQRIHHVLWNRNGSQQLRALVETRSQLSLRPTRATADETVLLVRKCRLLCLSQAEPWQLGTVCRQM